MKVTLKAAETCLLSETAHVNKRLGEDQQRGQADCCTPGQFKLSFYSPCSRLSSEPVDETSAVKIMWCGDFNGHSEQSSQ